MKHYSSYNRERILLFIYILLHSPPYVCESIPQGDPLPDPPLNRTHKYDNRPVYGLTP